jgi:hypothetical protein
MKFIIKRKNGVTAILSGAILVFFAFTHIVFASGITKENIINLVNQSRNENNVEALSENQKLDQAAENKLDDMIKNNYFAHTSPSGVTPWFWFEKNGYDYKYAGENLAMGFSTVEREHDAWMESPTHKRNILNPSYKEIGVAVGQGTIDNSLVTIAVQTFGSLANGKIEQKEEVNISDDKAKELIKGNKKENKGVVLNVENKNSNSGSGGSGVGLSKFLKTLFGDKELFNNSLWATTIIVFASCSIFNILVALIMVFHSLLIHLRRNQDVFKAVHSILILFLIGSIIFR